MSRGPHEGETVLVAEFPSLEDFVGPIRLAHDSSARRGLPAHVTIQYPFITEDELTPDDDGALAEILARHDPFDVTFAELGTFPRVVWLSPVPTRPFEQLVASVRGRWPEVVNEADARRGFTPHLTLAKGLEPAEVASKADEVLATIAEHLPERTRVRTLSLFARNSDLEWERRRVYELGGNSHG